MFIMSLSQPTENTDQNVNTSDDTKSTGEFENANDYVSLLSSVVLILDVHIL